MLGDFDKGLMHAINGWPEWLRPIMVFFSEGIRHAPLRIILGVLVVGMLWVKGKPRETIIQALLAWPFANLLTDAFKHALPAMRPNVELHDIILRTDSMSSAGTVSAHAANMTAVATVFCYRLKWWGAPWVFVAILTGLSRIYLGVHYPSQVILGGLCGLVVASLLMWIWNRFERNKAAIAETNAISEGNEAQGI